MKVLGLNSWEMGVLTITRIPPKGGPKMKEMDAVVYKGSAVDGLYHYSNTM
jgi:hypothetical protein